MVRPKPDQPDHLLHPCVMIVHVHTIDVYMYVITQNGWSALIRAASEDYTGVVVELVKARANLDLQDKVCHC